MNEKMPKVFTAILIGRMVIAVIFRECYLRLIMAQATSILGVPLMCHRAFLVLNIASSIWGKYKEQ